MFFSRELLNGFEGKEKRQMDGKLKMQLELSSTDTPLTFFSKIVWPVPKIAIEECFSSFVEHRMVMQTL